MCRQMLTYLAKRSILGVWQDSEYAYYNASFPRWALNRQCFWKKTMVERKAVFRKILGTY